MLILEFPSPKVDNPITRKSLCPELDWEGTMEGIICYILV